MARHELAALPEWGPGTVAVLSTAGNGPPHAIPVSTGVRAGDHRVVLALALRRESLTRLREDPRCALTVLAEGVACTALGRATIVQEPMDISDRVAAVAITVEEIQDHDQPRFEMLSGVGWRWTDAEAEARDAEIRAALARL
jgi:flavin reductase (DIM6/NTAB) family NADH-FMN oxidoreductase RutF